MIGKKLPDRVEHGREPLIEPFFELIGSSTEIFVTDCHFLEADESPHDQDVHPHRFLAPQNARKHRHAFLGERQRKRSASTSTLHL
ncbi:MAG: hypothetical protein JST04_12300 [Bdellovibrionales bacterium]|nr:hypothetical protein [Bdellovibrionales bacterium]